MLEKAVLHKTFGNRLKTFPAMHFLSKLVSSLALRKRVVQQQLP